MEGPGTSCFLVFSLCKAEHVRKSVFKTIFFRKKKIKINKKHVGHADNMEHLNVLSRLVTQQNNLYNIDLTT